MPRVVTTSESTTHQVRALRRFAHAVPSAWNILAEPRGSTAWDGGQTARVQILPAPPTDELASKAPLRDGGRLQSLAQCFSNLQEHRSQLGPGLQCRFRLSRCGRAWDSAFKPAPGDADAAGQGPHLGAARGSAHLHEGIWSLAPGDTQ